MENIPAHRVETLLTQGMFDPHVEHSEKLQPFERVVICGMGGSRLAGEFIKGILPDLDITIHASYGLPPLTSPSRLSTRYIISSYSGSTAEEIDAFHTALAGGITPSVVTHGGVLLDLAREHRVPHVTLPNLSIPPRESVIVSILAHLALLGRAKEIEQVHTAIGLISSQSIESEAEGLVKFLGGKTPLLYAPQELEGLLRTYKINFNETSRRPAFFALIPEVNHGEVEMFDGNEMTFPLSKEYAVVLFLAEGLDLRLSARVKLLGDLLSARGVPVRTIHFEDWSWRSAINGIAISMRTSGLWAERSDLSNAPATIIQEFKTKMKPFDDIHTS